MGKTGVIPKAVSKLDYDAIGERVRLRRRELKLTQEHLAEKISVSSSFIGHIERGEKKASMETIAALSRELRTSLDYIILGIKGDCDKTDCHLYRDMVELLRDYARPE